MVFRSIILAAPLLIAACSGPLVSNSDKRSAASGLENLRMIRDAALLGAYSSPRSFDLVAPEYVKALAGFRAAMPPASDDEARAVERDGVRRAFENCIEAVRAQIDFHRSSGLSDDPSDFLAIDVCESAAATLERSI